MFAFAARTSATRVHSLIMRDVVALVEEFMLSSIMSIAVMRECLAFRNYGCYCRCRPWMPEEFNFYSSLAVVPEGESAILFVRFLI